MSELHCRHCGWIGTVDELRSVTLYEDFGDYETVECPNCSAKVYDGYAIEDVFEIIFEQ